MNNYALPKDDVTFNGKEFKGVKGDVTCYGKDGRYDVKVEPNHVSMSVTLNETAVVFTSILTFPATNAILESYSQVRDSKNGDGEKNPIDKKTKEDWEERLGEILTQLGSSQKYRVIVLRAKEFLARVN